MIRKGMISTVGKAAGAAIGIVNGVIISRTLHPEGRGVYQSASSFNTVAITLAGLGIGQAAIYYINRQKVPIREVTTTILWYVMLIIPVGACVLLALYPHFPYFQPFVPSARVMLAVASLVPLGTYLLMPILLAELRAADAAVLDVTFFGVQTAVTAALALAGVLTIQTFPLAPLIGAIVALSYALLQVRRHIDWSIRPRWTLIRGMTGYGLQFASANIAFNLHTQVAPLVLGWLYRDQAQVVGFYGCATSVSGLIGFIGMAVNPLLFSALTAEATDERRTRQAEVAARLHVLLGFTGAIIVALFAKPIILFLYRREFLATVPLLRVVAFATAIQLVANALQPLFAALGRPILITGLFSITLTVNLLGNLILAPAFGAMGSALAMVISAIVYLVCCMATAKRLTGLRAWQSLIPQRSDLYRILAAAYPRAVSKSV